MEKTSFREYIQAGYPLLYLNTYEEDRAIEHYGKELADYNIYTWDLLAGFKNIDTHQAERAADPVVALTMVAGVPQQTIVFLKDFHKFIGMTETFRTIKNLLPHLKGNFKHLVIVSPVLTIPPELEKDVTIVNFDLPTVDQIVQIADKLLKGPDVKELGLTADPKVISVARGLTAQEAEAALSLSIISTKSISKEILEQEKLQSIQKTKLMEIWKASPESELGGLDPLKLYIRSRKRGFYEDGFPPPKGILLVGLPGGGKSLAAKVVASQLDFPLLRLDISQLKNSLMGESEARIRQALTLIDAVSPVVIFMDEIEKSLGGVQSSNRVDGGTTSAMFGYLLTWMQESKVPKYIVATCNDIDDLLQISQGALLRRFDDIFFVDLPNDDEKKDILHIMNRRYSASLSDDIIGKLQNYTGHEIEKFVIASIYDGVEDALNNTKTIYTQNREKIERAREWAKYNARVANTQKEEGDTRRLRAL